MTVTDKTAQTLTSTLRGFGVTAEVADVQRGAAVDRYALTLAPGVRTSAVTKLHADIALALGARDVRILAPIPGTKYVGVEVPAAEREIVTLGRLVANLPGDHPLRIPVGLAVDGSAVMARLDRLPHLLIAGTTGSGKSVWLTTTLAHLATWASPAQVQMLMVDPKRVELAAFDGLPHLAAPVATDVTMDAVPLLEDAVAEMDRRYEVMKAAGKRNVSELDDPPPHLIVAIEEMADLMMTAGKRAESAIVRLLQVGRAAGIHLLLATQRPSADVITPLIKANTPSRLVFAVQSHVDSGVALGQTGAQALLGQGDALWWPSGASQPERIQAPYVDTEGLEEMLAPLRRVDAVEPAEDYQSETLDVAEDCPAWREGDKHDCICKRGARHTGMHVCMTCGFGWSRTLDSTPTAPSAPTPEEPESVPPAPSEIEVDWKDPDARSIRAYIDALDRYAAQIAEVSETPQVADSYIADVADTSYQRGYDDGLRRTLPERRATGAVDWLLAALVAVAVLIGAAAVMPVLPLVAAVGGAWWFLRRRTDINPRSKKP